MPIRFPSFAPLCCFLAAMVTFGLTIGCGGSTEETAQNSPANAVAESANRPAELGPAEIVSQLLDRVRRGGENENSSELLTKLARQELARIGRPFEFPGSPDTVYEVKQALAIPNENDRVWVQTYLTEPMGNGQEFQYEVVWTLRKEIAGWRVCGFVIDQGDGMDPLEFDFENGDEMSARLAALETGEEQSTNR